MTAWNVVKGKRLRATRVDACGLPLAGPKAQLVTKGFVTVNLEPEWEDAEDLIQKNADGEIVVSDRTPPEMKWLNTSVEFCNVDPELINMLTDYPLVLDWANLPVGYRITDKVKVDGAVALELWAGTAGSDCEVPTSDDIFDNAGNLTSYGYFLLGAVKEATLSGIEIGANVATFTLEGIAVSAPRWGKGPYNVVPVDASNTPGRLLVPLGAKQFLHKQLTTVAPPAVTDGAVTLTLPSPYFTAPADEVQTVTVTGATGGTFTLTFDGQTTAGIAYNAAASAVQSALEALSNIGAGDVTVTGTAGGPYTVTFAGALADMNVPQMTADGASLTGTSPTVTVTTSTQGG